MDKRINKGSKVNLWDGTAGIVVGWRANGDVIVSVAGRQWDMDPAHVTAA